MLVDVLRQAGGEGAELLRRWAAALMIAPASERRAIVEAVERQMIELCDTPGRAEPMVHVTEDPVQRDGYTEVVVRSFKPGGSSKRAAAGKGKRSA